MYQPHQADRHAAVCGNHEKFRGIGMINQIVDSKHRQYYIQHFDRLCADIADRPHTQHHDNACDQYIAAGDDAVRTVSPARQFQSKQHNAPYYTNDANSKQHLDHEHTSSPGIGVVQQALHYHQH